MAKVEATNADVYLHERAPVFAYNPKSNTFMHATYDGSNSVWEVCVNGKVVGTTNPGHDMTTHLEMYSFVLNKDPWTDDYWMKAIEEIESLVRGRISPDGRCIYIHDLNARIQGGFIRRSFKKYVDKTVDKVYDYMFDIIN